MRTRDLLILALVVAFAAGIGLTTIGGDPDANGGLAPPGEPDAADENPAVVPDDGDPVAAEGGTDTLPALPTAQTERVDTRGWQSGVVRGDIQLAVSVLDKLETLTVIVEELRGPIRVEGRLDHPHRIAVPVERGVGTPTFEVRDIPFSSHPYAVRVFSPGLNGSQRTVTIDADTPLHDDIVLTVTPGRPFSVLVRDQDANPYGQVEVRLFPVGEPKGRGEHLGSTDGYGSAVFESVLAGDYQLFVGMRGVPLTEPEIVTVQQGARVYGSKIQGQGHTVVVQRGVPVHVSISDLGGYGAADAKVTLQATDRVKLTMLERTTDGGGRCEFPHVTPGKWMITVTKQNHAPWTTQITITDGQLPELVQGRLKRVR